MKVCVCVVHICMGCAFMCILQIFSWHIFSNLSYENKSNFENRKFLFCCCGVLVCSFHSCLQKFFWTLRLYGFISLLTNQTRYGIYSFVLHHQLCGFLFVTLIHKTYIYIYIVLVYLCGGGWGDWRCNVYACVCVILCSIFLNCIKFCKWNLFFGKSFPYDEEWLVKTR